MLHRISINSNLKETDMLILAGGLGTRLRDVVENLPKPMAEIDGRPFLDILMDYVAGYGLRRFVFCTGHMSDVIRRHYTGGESSREILISDENEPLGTAGAVKNAEGLIRSSPFFVMNGDSFCPVDLSDFYEFHREKGARVSMVVVEAENTGDYGLIALDDSNRITGFKEKGVTGGKVFINAGIYLFSKEVLSLIPPGKYSLEKDLFPKLPGREFYGYVTGEELIDIGTPERYRRARRVFSEFSDELMKKRKE